MPLKEYKLGTSFPSIIGRTIDQSEPAWSEPVCAKEDAPNVLFIVLNDTGFGQLSCCGGYIQKPNWKTGRGKAYVQQHAYGRSVLSQPLLHDYRTKSSFK